MKKLGKIFILLVLIFSFNLNSATAAGDSTKIDPSKLNLQDAFKTRNEKVCTGNDTLDCVANEAGFDVNKVTKNGSNDTIEPLIQNLINIILSLLGIIFIAMIILGGWSWFSARGNEQKLDKAKDTLTQAIIGLLIVIGAYAISYFVLSILIPYLK